MNKISFKQFVTEGSGSFTRRPLTPIETAHRIATSCKGWLELVKNTEEIPIWRGDDNHTSSALSMGDSNLFTRKAANTTNWYLMWIDNSPAWENYPKRGKAYICTSSVDNAGGYGTLHMVIPTDTAKIGIVPEADMWVAFKRSIKPFVEDSDASIEDLQLAVGGCANLVKVRIENNHKDIGELRRDLKAIKITALEKVIEEIRSKSNAIKPGLFDAAFSGSYHAGTNAAREAGREFYDLCKTYVDSPIGPEVSYSFVRGWVDKAIKMIAGMDKYGFNSMDQVYDAVLLPRGFKYLTGSELPSMSMDKIDDKEIWIQGSCLFVNVEDSNPEFRALSLLLKEQLGIDLTRLLNGY